MSKRTCTTSGCVKPHRAKGLCATHYNNAYHPDRHAKQTGECAWCGVEVVRSTGGGRKYGMACSNQCRQYLQTPYCKLPADHWALWFGRASTWKPKAERVRFTREQRACDWCETGYAPTQATSKHCSKRCQRRAGKARRRAREHQAPGEYTWAQVIRLHLLGGKRCAYCDDAVSQPEPDHVTPISRGGHNHIGNILPCCQACNADKGDMSLTEWALDRARRAKPAVRTRFDVNDKRFIHLTTTEPTGQSQRLLQASHLLSAQRERASA